MSKYYIGTKQIFAYPEIRGNERTVDGETVANPEDGYHVVYSKDTPDEYHSWSPKDVFEAAYQPLDAMSFGHALVMLKQGKRVARAGWNGRIGGKVMFIFLVPGSTFKVNRPPLLGIYPEGTEINYHAHIDLRTVDGTIVPWLASQTDMLAEDYCIVE